MRLRQVPNLKKALTALVTLCHAKMAGCLDLLAWPKAAYLYSIVRQVLANNFGASLLRPLRTAQYPGRETLEMLRTELIAEEA